MRLTPALFLLALLPAAAPAAQLLLRAETCPYHGGWQRSANHLASGQSDNPAPVVCAIRLPTTGRWRLWVWSKDVPEDRPGIRNFTVRLGNTSSETVFGRHGRPENDGWSWEDGGVFDLPAGPLLAVLGEKATSFARVEALLLSDTPDYQPPASPEEWRRLPQAPAAPLAIRPLDASGSVVPPPLGPVGERVAILKAGGVDFAFHRAGDAAHPSIALRVTTAGRTLFSEAESYRVLWRPAAKPPIIRTGVFPQWDAALAPPVEAEAGGATVRMAAGPPTAPWVSGICRAIRPVSARQVDAATVELGFTPLPEGELKATWRLPQGSAGVRVELRFVPKDGGSVSLGYHGAVAEPVSKLDFVLLPPMYHGRRLPPPALLLSALTSAPMTLVNRAGVSYALVAEPSELTQDWLSAHNSKFGFGLRNESGDAQPLVYSPVLGQPGSAANAGAAVASSFRVVVHPGDWYAAYRHVALDLFGVKDHRRAVTASLSDAVLNLFDLMKGGTGWDERAKGPWNIEARNTVTHSAPLTYLSFALLTGDTEFYEKYARPSLEFLASRATAHFVAADNSRNPYYRGDPLGGPVRSDGATTYSAAFAMTRGKTAPFGAMTLDAAGGARPTPNGHVRPFGDALALYRLTGDRKWLDEAVAGADAYIADNLSRLPENDVGPVPFINVSFVPDWEDLLHVYEETGQKRFLDASAEAARWLLTSIFIHPVVPPGARTIHPGGEYRQPARVWYLGDKRYRLGLYDEASFSHGNPIQQPPAKLPEKAVPAWTVESAGLGLEQPVTYFRTGNMANIFMSIWAPNLLRLAAHTGDDLFRTAARNATIGRFANYPGYYSDGFTDEYMKPDYPVKGPDVTWLYYHHVPPFAAYVVDYLFTDAEVRSKGRVRFPAVRQNGYVWFDSRLFGHAPGTVYGRKAWPWLHRTAASVDNIQVDRVLAHGDDAFFITLLNQTYEPQAATVRFDAAALGRPVDKASVRVLRDGGTGKSIPVENGAARVTLPPGGFLTLMLEGTKIRVATHDAETPGKLALPASSGIERKRVANAGFDAVGMILATPPLGRRDLFVYVASPPQACSAATLTYRVGSQPEKQERATRYPCEFTVPLPPSAEPVEWRVSVPR